MQTLNSSSVQYAPAPTPADTSKLQLYIETELRNIQTAVMALAAGHLDKSYAAPDKPREGDMRFADGATWNPGSGPGLYIYDGATWSRFSVSVLSVLNHAGAVIQISISNGLLPVLTNAGTTVQVPA
jgi:hypothetical protein